MHKYEWKWYRSVVFGLRYSAYEEADFLAIVLDITFHFYDMQPEGINSETNCYRASISCFLHKCLWHFIMKAGARTWLYLLLQSKNGSNQPYWKWHICYLNGPRLSFPLIWKKKCCFKNVFFFFKCWTWRILCVAKISLEFTHSSDQFYYKVLWCSELMLAY